MKNCSIILANIFLILLCGPALLYAINRPDPDIYLNPYSLMVTDEEQMFYLSGQSWYVMCNRADAPIFDQPIGEQIDKAEYLERFKVTARKDSYVHVQYKTKKGNDWIWRDKGWMDMRHLILTQRAIKDPQTKVYHKAFQMIRIEDRDHTEEGLNSLRLRNGPGEGVEPGQSKAEGQYTFLTQAENISRVGSLFYYVYGVAFNDNDEKKYQDIEKFKNADYFLIGEITSMDSADMKKGKKGSIKGWIPKSGAILWDTRQALEKLSDRPSEDWDAHKFSNRPLLGRYFFLKDNAEAEQIFLAENAEDIVRDLGEGPPESGQTLRDLVLDVGHQQENKNGIVSEFIGYSGYSAKRNLVSTSDESHEEQRQQQLQQVLRDMQQGAQYLEVFFLVDATSSMGPSLNAAAQVTKKMLSQIKALKGI